MVDHFSYEMGLSKVTTPVFYRVYRKGARRPHRYETWKEYYGKDLSKRPQFTKPSSGRYTDLEYDNEYIVDNYTLSTYLGLHEEMQLSHLLV